MSYTYRKLQTEEERDAALALAGAVFDTCVGPGYEPSGRETFHAYLDSLAVFPVLEYWGAFSETGELVGMLGAKDHNSHISLLFVRNGLRGSGIGRGLTELLFRECRELYLTVHAAPGAAGFYRKMGFADTDAERLEDGIRYIPMRRRRP